MSRKPMSKAARAKHSAALKAAHQRKRAERAQLEAQAPKILSKVRRELERAEAFVEERRADGNKRVDSIAFKAMRLRWESALDTIRRKEDDPTTPLVALTYLSEAEDFLLESIRDGQVTSFTSEHSKVIAALIAVRGG